MVFLLNLLFFPSLFFDFQNVVAVAASIFVVVAALIVVVVSWLAASRSEYSLDLHVSCLLLKAETVVFSFHVE